MYKHEKLQLAIDALAVPPQISVEEKGTVTLQKTAPFHLMFRWTSANVSLDERECFIARARMHSLTKSRAATPTKNHF